MKCSAKPGTSLTLHIGTGKAGSTSIQNHIAGLKALPRRPRLIDTVLGSKPMPLRAFGLPPANKLTCACGGDRTHRYFVLRRKRYSEKEFNRFAQSVWKKARQEVAASHSRDFVASSEFLGAFLGPEEIRRLREELVDLFERVTIVAYLRDQRSFLPSLWAQSIKGADKSHRSFGEFMNTLDDRRDLWDYSIFLERWLDCFGQKDLKVTVFDPNALYKGDVVDDFFFKAGSPKVPIKLDQPRANVSPSWHELEVMRLENLARKFPNCEVSSQKYDVEAEIVECRDLILEKVSESNKWINEVFLKDSNVHLPTL